MSYTIHYFAVDVEVEIEQTRRDEFGWVEGHGPGNGNFKLTKETVNVKAPDERYARAWLDHYYSSGCCRNLNIVNIRKESLHIHGDIKVT